MKVSLDELADIFDSRAADLSRRMNKAVEETAKDVQMRAMLKLGQYQDGWAPLAASTQRKRAARGYPADEPLLVTNALRSSIAYTLVGSRHGVAAYIGSDLPYARRQELGYGPTPPRPYLAPALVETMPEVGRRVEALIRGLFE